MKINSPNESVFTDGTTLASLLNAVKANRRGEFKNFFSLDANWDAFIADNERLHDEFQLNNKYTPSITDYSSVRGALINLYNGSSAFKECSYISNARKSYNGIKCPYCRQGVCSTLDHYFDKDAHCELALNPWNLVPSCGDCNFKKLNKRIESPNKRFFHPFFDAFFAENQELSLYYTKIELYQSSNLFTLSLEAHPDLDANLKSIVNWHIKEMSIGKTVGVIIREDFRYWARKVRSRMDFLDSDDMVREYLERELHDEISFTWRGVPLKSIVSNENNFRLFCEVVTNSLYRI